MTTNSVNLYDNVYSDFAGDVEHAVRRQTYGEDLRQSIWLTAREWLEFADQLGIIANRADVLRDWYRLLRPGGRALFTDAMVVTGTVSNEELASRWHDARARHRAPLVDREGEANFDGQQRFLRFVHLLSVERRLSRYAYLAEKH